MMNDGLNMSASPMSIVSRGVLRRMFELDSVKVSDAILQVVQIRPVENKQGHQDHLRFRVVLNDTVNWVQGMIVSQLAHLVTDGTLKRGNIIRLIDYNPNALGRTERKLLVLLNFQVLAQYGELEKLGVPKPLDETINNPSDSTGNGGTAAPGQGTTLATASTSSVNTSTKPLYPQNGMSQDTAQQPGSFSGSSFYGANKPTPGSASYGNALNSREVKPKASAQHANIIPIKDVNPYQHKWKIRAICSYKSTVRTWQRPTGEGKLFNLTLVDDSGEIRATAFNSECDTFFDTIQEQTVYYISTPCKVQFAKRQFSQVNNDYELVFERDTQVEKAEDQSNVPQIRFSFTSIGNLQDIPKDTTIDTIGIIKDVGEPSEIVSKSTNKPYTRRELCLVDDSLHSVKLTIWGDVALKFQGTPETVAAFKGVKVSDFGGRSLSLLSSGSIHLDPDIEAAHRLKGWYDLQGRTDQFTDFSSLNGSGQASGSVQTQLRSPFGISTIKQIKDDEMTLTMSEEAQYFIIKGTIISLRSSNIAYPACREEKCNRKVSLIRPGEWHCERCDKSFDRPVYRYILSINVSDHTGQVWLTCFDDSARIVMLGKTADEVVAIQNQIGDADTMGGELNGGYSMDNEAFNRLKSEVTFQTFFFRCRIRMDNYQDQTRARYQTYAAYPLDYVTECSRLTQLINLYDQPDANVGGKSEPGTHNAGLFM